MYTCSRGTILIIVQFLFSSILVLSQPIENNFIDALVNNKSSIADFIDNDELKRSERLGISYSGVTYKWLVSFDIPDDIKAGFRERKYDYTLQSMQLEDGFSVVTLAVGSINYLQKFYFLNSKFVPPSRYFTRNWEVKESRYFKFRISEPKYFNDYCIKRLDDDFTVFDLEPVFGVFQFHLLEVTHIQLFTNGVHRLEVVENSRYGFQKACC